jgi:hypothetical protein
MISRVPGLCDPRKPAHVPSGFFERRHLPRYVNIAGTDDRRKSVPRDFRLSVPRLGNLEAEGELRDVPDADGADLAEKESALFRAVS